MAPLAKATDLALLLGRPATDAGLQLALRRASDAFADAVGIPVIATTETVLLRGDGSRDLLLPARPVTAATVQVGKVTETAESAPDAALLLDSRLGILTRRAGWPDGEPVLVTFTHGWPETEIPGAISDVVLERAVHIAEQLGIYEATGPFRVTSAAAGGATQRWVETVARYQVGIGDRS